MRQLRTDRSDDRRRSLSSLCAARTGLPFERLAEPVTAELTELFRHRLVLTRYLTDLDLALPAS